MRWLPTVSHEQWISASGSCPRGRENAEAVVRALPCFGALLQNITQDDSQTDGTVFQIGVAPRRIDIITTVSGLDFEEAFRRSMAVDVEGIEVRIPSLADLIHNKRASGRTKDLADVEALEEIRDSEQDNAS